MYVKAILSNGSGSQLQANLDLKNLIDNVVMGGSVTVGAYLNGYINVHEVTGTSPTAGIYSTTQQMFSNPAYYQSWTKKHPDNNACTRTITWYYDNGNNYGTGFCAGTGNFGINSVGGSYIRSAASLGPDVNRHFPYSNPAVIPREVHIIVTDNVFAVFQTSLEGGGSTHSQYNYMFMDLEYNNTVDDHLLNVNSMHYPGIEYATVNVYAGTSPVNGGTVIDTIVVYAPQWYDGKTQSFNNRVAGGIDSNTASILDESVNTGVTIAYFLPRLKTTIGHKVGDDLATRPYLIPMSFGGFQKPGTEWNSIPRELVGVYKTSDDILVSGDSVVSGSPAIEHKVLGPFATNTENGNRWSYIAVEI